MWSMCGLMRIIRRSHLSPVICHLLSRQKRMANDKAPMTRTLHLVHRQLVGPFLEIAIELLAATAVEIEGAADGVGDVAAAAGNDVDAGVSVGPGLKDGVAVTAGHSQNDVGESYDPLGKRLAFVLCEIETAL